jgi:hypothetical protein
LLVPDLDLLKYQLGRVDVQAIFSIACRCGSRVFTLDDERGQSFAFLWGLVDARMT